MTDGGVDATVPPDARPDVSDASAASDVPSDASATSDVPSDASAASDVPSDASAASDVPSDASAASDVPSDACTTTSPSRCGAVCCAAGQTCVAGACQASAGCYPGETLCGATCANLTTANAHCGRCGNACPVWQGCAAGVCVNSCPSSAYTACPIGDASFYCASTAADPRNCGSCGNACPAGMLCARTAPGTPPSCQRVGGFCTGAALLACGELCRDHLNDVSNCGGCNVRCAAGQRCVGGACVAAPV